MKVLLLSLGNSPARYKFMQNHIENFVERDIAGHEIITFGYNEGVDIKIDIEDDFSRVIEGLPDKWSPDFCLLWEIEWNLLPPGIEDAPFPLISLVYDIDYDIPLARACVKTADITVSLAEKEEVKIRSIGADNVEVYYYIGMMKELVCPAPKKIKDRSYDIFYTTWINDHEYPDRSKWILQLSALSERYNVLIESHLPSYKAYIELLQDSKLVLSHNRFGSMSGRVLEAASQGTVVIETGTEVKKHFEPDKEFIPVTEENFIGQIEKYLRDDGYLQRMSDSAYAKVTQNYESRVRFAGLLEFIGEHLKNSTIKRKTRDLSEIEKFNQRGEVYYYAHFRTVPGAFIMNAEKRLLELSIKQFEKAVSINFAPRYVTNLAVAKTAYYYLFQKERMMNEKLADVIALLENVTSEQPDYAMAYFHLGVVQLKVGNSGEASKMFCKALELFRDHESDVDPWCLHNKDDYVFNQLIKRNLNEYLMLLCKGDENEAMMGIRKMYQAVIIYYLAHIKESAGFIYDAVENLVESFNLSPGTGQIISSTGTMLAALGYREEGLMMFEKAIALSPLNIEMRNDYIKHLYLNGKDREVVNQTKIAHKLVKTINALREKSVMLKETINSLNRLNSDAPYSFDICSMGILGGYAEMLFEYLRKDPGNINLIVTIIGLWNENGRVHKSLELFENYLGMYFDPATADEQTLNIIREVYEYLRKTAESEGAGFSGKIENVQHCLDLIGKEPEKG